MSGKILVSLLLFLFSLPLEGYYQIIPMIRYTYDNNLSDFGSLMDDEEGYSEFVLNFWWDKHQSYFFLSGDITISLLLSSKLYTNSSVFNRMWEYSPPEISKGEPLDLKIAFEKLLFGYKKNRFEVDVGLIPFTDSSLSFSDLLAGSRLQVDIFKRKKRRLLLGFAFGGYLVRATDEKRWFIEVTPAPTAWGFPFSQNNAFFLWLGANGENFRTKIFFSENSDNLKNTGYTGVFFKKRSSMRVEYVVSSSNLSKGDAFLLSGRVGSNSNFIKAGYIDVSGYDYTIANEQKQSAFQSFVAYPSSGNIFIRYLRSLPPVDLYFIEGKVTRKIFSLKLSVFRYFVSGYANPFPSYLGTEFDTLASYDRGWYFFSMDYSVLFPGEGLKSVMENFLFNEKLKNTFSTGQSTLLKVEGGIRF